MKKSIGVLLMVFGLCGSAYAVTEIDAAGFAKAVEKGSTIVEFYSPACPHCRNMIPVLDQYEKTDGAVKVIRVDVMKNQELAKSMSVDSYPIFMNFKDGKEVYRYKGEMPLEKFVRRASLLDKPDQSVLIDIRVEDLKAEYQFLIDRGNKMTEEIRKIQERITQIPASIDELEKLKQDSSGGCPDGNCGG